MAGFQFGVVDKLRFRLAARGVAWVPFLMFSWVLAAPPERAWAGGVYVQKNLVSDISGMAGLTDPHLKDPWGLSFSTGSAFWVSDQASNLNGMSVTSLYSVNGTSGAASINRATFGIPDLGGAAPNLGTNGPTGQVNTSAPGITTSPTDFQLNGAKANFIFAKFRILVARSTPLSRIRATPWAASWMCSNPMAP